MMKQETKRERLFRTAPELIEGLLSDEADRDSPRGLEEARLTRLCRSAWLAFDRQRYAPYIEGYLAKRDALYIAAKAATEACCRHRLAT